MIQNLYAILFVVQLFVPQYCNSQVDSFSLYFPIGGSTLSLEQKKYIDSQIYSRTFSSSVILKVFGFTDEPGTQSLNKMIARKRAASVQSYLLKFGLCNSIIIQYGSFSSFSKKSFDAEQRRVDVLFFRQSMLDSNSGIQTLAFMQPNEKIALKNLLFEDGSAVLLKQSLPTLNELLEVLRSNPRVRIKIEGHICCGGDSDLVKKAGWRYEVSVARAKAVNDYLVKHGIYQERLSFEGFGFTAPLIYPEKSADDMRQNRRVELRVFSNK